MSSPLFQSSLMPRLHPRRGALDALTKKANAAGAQR
jgi:hypothetical protein